MNAFFSRIFGLSSLSLGGENTRVEFALAWPAWVWVLVVIACVAGAWWTYWKLLGSARKRFALAALRALALLLLAVIIAGPRLVRPNERTERDWVILLADRSRSMTVPDAPPALASGTTPRTRDEQLGEALTILGPSLDTIKAKRELLALGFDAGVYDIPVRANRAATEPWLELSPPTGDRTAINTALSEALKRAAARPVAGVLLFTDGRSFDAPSRALLNSLKDRQIPIFPVALGSEFAPPDLVLTKADAPRATFVGDLVPVSVEVSTRGGDPDSPARPTGKVQLLDASGTVLDEKALAPIESSAGSAGPTQVLLQSKSANAGAATWTVRVVPEGPDLSKENNTLSFPVDVADKPIRLLYIDGGPRWEYRYLKNIILREKGIKSSTMILAADRRYIVEGTDPVRTLPRTASDWGKYDVVVMGDVRPGLFSADQLAQLREVVAQRGVGLLWVGGASYTPGAWRGTVLGELIPFTDTSLDGVANTGTPTFASPVLMTPAPASRSYGLLQLADLSEQPASGAAASSTPAGSGEFPGWPAYLSSTDATWNTLRWAQRIDARSVKPSAEVLAYAVPALPAGVPQGQASPLMLTMRYGAGRVVYMGTDETWRLRYGRGEALTERLWVPVMRLLARGSLGRTGKPAVLEISPDDATVRQPVRVSIKLLDQSLIDQRRPSLRVVLREAGTGTASSTNIVQELSLQAESSGEELTALPGAAAPVAVYAAVLTPTQPGEFVLASDDPLLAGLELAAPLRVAVPEDELRTPQADFASLEQLARATGGKVLSTADLTTIESLLPKREVIIQGTPDVETLWDKPIVWTVLMLLLAAEWLGRRFLKLA